MAPRLLFTFGVKTTFLMMGLAAVAAMNLVACTDIIPSFGCSTGSNDFVNEQVAPLTFVPTTSALSCDAKTGIVLDLADTSGSQIHITVLPSAQLEQSLPLTADAPATTNTVASSSADGTAKVTLVDAEYNELPTSWSNAAVTFYSLPYGHGGALDGEVEFYFADGRTLSYVFDAVPSDSTQCQAVQTN